MTRVNIRELEKLLKSWREKRPRYETTLHAAGRRGYNAALTHVLHFLSDLKEKTETPE